MREGFFFCISPDEELIMEFVEQKIGSLPGVWKKKLLWGDEDIREEFFRTFQASSLLGENTCLVVRRAHMLPPLFWEALTPLLRRFKPDIFPFFCLEGEWKRGRPLIPPELSKRKYYLLAQKRKWIFQKQGITPHELTNYIHKWAKNKDISISPEIMLSLIEILPLHLGRIKREMKKLELYLGEKKVLEMKDLEVISPFFKHNVFEFINRLERISPSSPQDLASTISQGLYTSHETILPLINLLFREARILWKLCMGEDVNLPPWVMEKKRSLAKRMGTKALQKMWDILIEAEVILKTSSASPEETASQMLVELHHLFDPQQKLHS